MRAALAAWLFFLVKPIILLVCTFRKVLPSAKLYFEVAATNITFETLDKHSWPLHFITFLQQRRLPRIVKPLAEILIRLLWSWRTEDMHFFTQLRLLTRPPRGFKGTRRLPRESAQWRVYGKPPGTMGKWCTDYFLSRDHLSCFFIFVIFF